MKMLENRFRLKAFIKSLKIIVEVSGISYDRGFIIVGSVDEGVTRKYYFEEIELLQCTGFEDKKGQLIFAGDIIVFGDIFPGEKWKIKWMQHKSSFRLVSMDDTENYMFDDEKKDLLIIDNIYRNGNS